ncbi:MAG: hypothetical protein MJ234_02810 [bacterium]|nr:hypothetical protein [bacterium]
MRINESGGLELAEKLSDYSGKEAPEKIRTFFRASGTENGLELVFESRFESLRTAPDDAETLGGKTLRLWDISDVFEMFVSWGELKKYREFQFAPDGRFLDIDIDASGSGRKTDFSWESGLSYEASAEKGIWHGRALIPWSAFPCGKPAEGDVWHINFYGIMNTASETAYLAWSPVHEINFHKPECFGEIIF